MCPAAPLHSTSYNFPSLLEEGSLLEELQGCEDWEAMQEVAESWLEGHWAAKGPQLVAGRAEALARQVGGGVDSTVPSGLPEHVSLVEM